MNYNVDQVSVFWTAGTAKMSKAIMHFEKSAISHVGLEFKFPSVTLLVESLDEGVVLTPREHIDRAMEARKISRYHTVALDTVPHQRSLLYRKALDYHGDGYDWGQLLIYLAWVKLWRRKQSSFLEKLSGKSGRVTCNELVCGVCHGLASEFVNADFTWTPEGIFKHLHNGIGSREWFNAAPNPVISAVPAMA